MDVINNRPLREPYGGWCGRTARELIPSLLSDYLTLLLEVGEAVGVHGFISLKSLLPKSLFLFNLIG